MQTPLTPGNGTAPPRFRLDDLEVDVGKAEVTRAGEAIALPKLSFDLLCALITAAPAIVTNEDLLEQVWPGLQVSPESVAQRVKLLRSAIGDDSQQPRYILAVRGRGYRLIPTVERCDPSLQVGAASNPTASTSSSAIPVQPTSRSVTPMSSNDGSKRVIVAAAVLFAIGVAVWVGWRSWSSSQPAVRPSAVAMTDKSIAVLPFADMSEKKDQEYFGDGMADEIIGLLARFPKLKVIGRTSSFQFKGKSQDLRSIGTQLGVAYVLEGSVRKSGDRMRVTAQLIDSRNNTPRWSQTYDRDFSDVLNLQDEIANKVVRLVAYDAFSNEFVSRKALRSPEAYSAYLQGVYAMNNIDQQGTEKAVGNFQRAIELDPTFADAAAQLANAYQILGAYGLMPQAEAFEKSRIAAERALKIDPQLRFAHWVLGDIHITYDWDWRAAEREFKLSVAPNDAAVQTVPLLAMTMGRLDDALSGINAYIAGDPMNAESYFLLGLVQLHRGRLPEAEAALNRTIELSPNFNFGHYELGLVELTRKKPEAALAEFMKEPSDLARIAGCGLVYFTLGRKAESDAALAQVIKDFAPYSPTAIAGFYAFRGESDEAFKWLDRAYLKKDTFLHGIKYRTEFDKLHDDPRYKAFLKKMNLPE